MHKGRPRTEALPYRMADGQWHKVALSVSASHLLLHVDCSRIYERVIDPPETSFPPGSNLWLGQRNQKHSLFKGVIQDGKIIFMPNGYITQCPNLNRTCPTCSDFLSLVQGIMDLQELLAKMTAKLNHAERRLSQLENCHCEKICQVSGLLYRDQDSWVDGDHCRNCTCKSGVVECRRMSCPPPNCSPDALPVHIAGQCCKVCRPKCIYGGKVLAEGQRILTKICQECRGGVLVKITETCPTLNCSKNDHILPENQCCRVCRGHNFCVEAPKCGENSECKNWNMKATCECKSGYISVQGDPAYCEVWRTHSRYHLTAAFRAALPIGLPFKTMLCSPGGPSFSPPRPSAWLQGIGSSGEGFLLQNIRLEGDQEGASLASDIAAHHKGGSFQVLTQSLNKTRPDALFSQVLLFGDPMCSPQTSCDCLRPVTVSV
nr:protein kinase C-binding protein NELL1-like [Cavia porcellus]